MAARPPPVIGRASTIAICICAAESLSLQCFEARARILVRSLATMLKLSHRVAL